MLADPLVPLCWCGGALSWSLGPDWGLLGSFWEGPGRHWCRVWNQGAKQDRFHTKAESMLKVIVAQLAIGLELCFY